MLDFTIQISHEVLISWLNISVWVDIDIGLISVLRIQQYRNIVIKKATSDITKLTLHYFIVNIDINSDSLLYGQRCP